MDEGRVHDADVDRAASGTLSLDSRAPAAQMDTANASTIGGSGRAQIGVVSDPSGAAAPVHAGRRGSSMPRVGATAGSGPAEDLKAEPAMQNSPKVGVGGPSWSLERGGAKAENSGEEEGGSDRGRDADGLDADQWNAVALWAEGQRRSLDGVDDGPAQRKTPAAMRLNRKRTLQIVTEKLPRTERGVFDKLYSGTRGFRRYRDVQKEAVSRFGSTGLGNLTITDISTLTRQGVQSTAGHLYAPYSVLASCPVPDRPPALRARSRSAPGPRHASLALRKANQIAHGHRRLSDCGLGEMEALGRVGRVDWDPEEPETDIQRTLKQRFEGSKKLAERMANLEQMRVGQGGGNAPQSAGRRKKEHPWAEEVAEKGKRFGGSLLGALGAAGPVPEEMLHVAEEVERVQAEKREMTKAYMVGMEEILVDTHPYMLRAKRAARFAEKVKMIASVKEMDHKERSRRDDMMREAHRSVPGSRASIGFRSRTSADGARNAAESIASPKASGRFLGNAPTTELGVEQADGLPPPRKSLFRKKVESTAHPETYSGPKEGARKAWVTSTSGKTQNSEAEIQLLTLQQGVTAQSSLARGARAQQQDKRMSLLSVPESSTDLGSSGRPVRRVSQPKGFGGPRLSGVEEEGPSMSASARKSKQSARKSARSGLFEGKSHRSAASVGEGGSAHSLKTKQSVVSRMSNFFARKSQADVLGLESKKPKTRRASITDLLHIGQDAMNPDLLRSQAHDPLFWEMAKPYYSLAGRHYPGLEEEPELHVAMFRTWVKMVSPWPGFDVYWAINMCRHEMVIIKVYNLRMMSANAASRVAREIVIRETVKHRGMTQYLGTFMHGDIVGLVTRASQTGDFLRMSILDTTNGKLDESSAATRVLLPVMSALRYLHKQGIVHRNVRPEYIVEDSSGMARLGGWEFVKRADSRPTTPVGPLDYMAPEMVLGALAREARQKEEAETHRRLAERAKKQQQAATGVAGKASFRGIFKGLSFRGPKGARKGAPRGKENSNVSIGHPTPAPIPAPVPTPVIGGGRPKSSVALAPAPVIRSGRASPSVGPSAGSNVGDSGRVQGEKKERPKGLRFGMVIDEPSAAPRSLALVPEGDAEPAGSGPKWGAGSVGFAGDKGESTARGRSKTAFAELENGEERRGRGRVRVMSGAGSSQMQGDDEEEGDEKGKGGSVVGGMLPWRRRGRSVAKSKVEGSEVDAESRHGWGRVKSRLWGRSVAKSKFEGSEVDDDGSVRPKRKSRMWGGSEAGEDGDARKKWGKGKSVKTAQGARSVRMRKRFTFFGMMGRDSSDEDDHRAPRLLDVRRHGEQYSAKVDSWAIGCLAFELLCGRCPFEVDNTAQSAALILFSDITHLPSYLSHDAIDFITKALRRVPEERPSIEELMKHPFITHHADSTRELMQLEAVMEQQALREEAAQQVSADRSSLKQSSTRARRPRKQNSGQAAPFPLPPGLRASIELGSSDDEGNGGLGGLLRRHQKKAFEVPAKERRRLVEAIRERQLQLSLAWFLRELDAITNKERKSRRGRDVNLLCFKRGGGVKEPGGEAPEATEAATAPEQV